MSGTLASDSPIRNERERAKGRLNASKKGASEGGGRRAADHALVSLRYLPRYAPDVCECESHDREREQKDNECSLRARQYTGALRDF